ncbi:MAG: tetratricopeptide repeat protein [Limisphaerales bacterium]
MKKTFLHLIVMLACLVGITCFAQTNAESFYHAGCSAFNAGNYKAALTNFTSSIELNPKMPIAYCMRGRARWWLKDYNGAIEDHDKSIALDPKCGGYYSNRGQAEYSLKMMREALIDFNKAIELDPTNAQAYFNRGSLKFHSLTNYVEAVADFTKAIEIHTDPNEEDIYLWRGNARMELQDYAGAITDYQKALELSPRHIGFQSTITNLAIAQKLLSKSEKK